MPAALLMLIRNIVFWGTAGYANRLLKVLAASAILGTCMWHIWLNTCALNICEFLPYTLTGKSK